VWFDANEQKFVRRRQPERIMGGSALFSKFPIFAADRQKWRCARSSS